jgi:hypothetical protein
MTELKAALSESINSRSCFESFSHCDTSAAASATGCEVKITEQTQYYDLRQNSVLADDFSDNVMQHLNMTVEKGGLIGASTDFVDRICLPIANSG